MKPKDKKHIIVSVITDLISDNRVHKVCCTLTGMGYEVTLVGRMLSDSPSVTGRPYATHRFRLLINKGLLFYAFYNFRLLLYLLGHHFDVLLANDLDTLPANILASGIKRKPIVYDSHEYFTEVPELIGRPGTKRIWEWIEGKLVPHVHEAITVCKSIAAIYTEKYKIHFHVVRNLPVARKVYSIKEEGHLPAIMYQGSLNPGRGLECCIRAMKHIEGARLVIAGDGELKKKLMALAISEGVSHKVEFLGRLPLEELAEITPKASVGVSVEEDLGWNYHYALPNKLFDYIQARVPVFVSNLPEMAAVVKQYGIGVINSDFTPRGIANMFNEMINNDEKRKVWLDNLEYASGELIWEKEEKIIQQIFNKFL